MSVSRFVCCVLVMGSLGPALTTAAGVCSSKVRVEAKGVKGALCKLQQHLVEQMAEGHAKIDDVQTGVNETREDIRRAMESMAGTVGEIESLKEHALAGMTMMTALRDDVKDLKKMVKEIRQYFMGDGSSEASTESEEEEEEEEEEAEVTCRSGYASTGGTCYMLSTSPMAAADARGFCEGEGGRVASATSDGELENIQSFLQDKGVTVNVESVEGLTGPERFEKIKVGTRVSRGEDWSWGEQDGGDGIGTVTRVTTPTAWLRVQWDNGHHNSYRMGVNGKYDLKLDVVESLYVVWMTGIREGVLWKDGDDVIEYLKWMPGQPNNADDLENCLQLGYSVADETLLMNDYSCQAVSNVVCQAEPTSKK